MIGRRNAHLGIGYARILRRFVMPWAGLAVLPMSACADQGLKVEVQQSSCRFFGAYNGRRAGEAYGIGVAVASAPRGPWIRCVECGKLIAAPIPYLHLAKPTLALVGDTIFLYVQAVRYTPKPLSNILLFTSLDGVTWRQDMGMSLADAWRPVIHYDVNALRDRFHLWYRSTADDIEMASSQDGRSWRRHGVVLRRGTAGAFDALAVAPGSVMPQDSGYALLYEAVDGNFRFSGGLAVSRTWTGELAKVGAGPVFEPDGIETSLAVRTAIGDSVLVTTDASGFRAGMTVYVVDKRGRWSAARIRAIAGNKIVLSDGVPFTYDAVNGTVIRSFAYSKVYPTSILRDHGELIVFSTAFDPELGITSAGIESMATLRGTDLRALRWDFETAPPLPLNSSSDTSWDAASRENLSAIDVGNRALAGTLARGCRR